MGAERMPERMPGDLTTRKGASRLSLGPAGLTLTVETEASATRLIEERSDAIAAHLGISSGFTQGCYAKNRAYWVYLEERWMREAFGPLAPRHLAARQEREDRRKVRDVRLAARREAYAKGFGLAASSGATDDTFSASPFWQRLIVFLLDSGRHLAGAVLVVPIVLILILFAGADWLAHWLAHHSPLPLLARAARFLRGGS